MPKKAAPRADEKAKLVIADLRANRMAKPSISSSSPFMRRLTYYAFPDDQSCLNLEAARLRHIAGTAWSTKYYMNMRPLYRQLSETGAVGRKQKFERVWTVPYIRQQV
ncbi:hypothetical protein [Bradyrhizobium neotropicale]|uniref:hypothetical protein n=1 Tax=Bradyrhizobium neotropicale TaxID=1497615 RepID=UPI001FEE0929|nr:hypothetical protein [Bradyrhizobium neotropicale]